jgi:hypothetical protein
MKYPNPHFNKKDCKYCGQEFQPEAPSRHYCGEDCKYKGYINSYLKRLYKISYKDYEEMLDKQDHKCKICKKDGFLMKSCHKMRLVVDHCHKSGNVRGLLCHNCNRALGLLEDSEEVLLRAVEYLKEGSETIRKEYT